MNPKTEYVKEECCGLDHHHSKPRGKNNFTVSIAISGLIEFHTSSDLEKEGYYIKEEIHITH